MSFTHTQGGRTVSTTSPVTLTLTSNPVQGNVVCVGVTSQSGAGITGVSVHDSNSNSYSVTPNSPSSYVSGAGQVYLFYLVAPFNATKTLTISFTGTGGGVWADEFTVSGGVAVFDKDVTAQPTGGSSTTANTPTLTPTNGAGELMYSAMTVQSVITAPAANATLGIWTGSAGAINTNMAEYDLSSGSGFNSVQYTMSSTGGWSGMIMAFYIIASLAGPAIYPTAVAEDFHWLGGDE